MIQHNILDLDAIYDLLGPEDEEVQSDAQVEFDKAKEFVRQMNVVSTKDKDEKGKDEKVEVDEVDPSATVSSFTHLIFKAMYF